MMTLRRVTLGVFAVSLLFAGCSGDDGAKGDAGPQGEKGEQGEPGKDGAPGKDATNGSNGEPGKDGDPGEPGKDGEPGQDGMNADDGAGGAGEGGAPPTASAERTLSFQEVSFATTTMEKHSVRASKLATVNGQDIAIDFHNILRSGEDPSKPNKACDLENSPTTCAGAFIDASGKLMKDDNAQARISNYNDFSSLVAVGDNKFLVHAFEETPAQLYVTKLTQDASGAFAATATNAVDVSGVDGLYRTCAGSVTPWGTHIAAEESQVDARPLDAATGWADLVKYGRWSELRSMGQYLGFAMVDANVDKIPDTDSFEAFQSKFSAYNYGYAVEVSLDAAGAPTVKKHYAMGRMGMELAYVMPDNKTVYLTDDVTNGGLFMFVADTAGDLSAGSLYAMRVYQLTPNSTFKAEISWVNLGHATDAEVKALLHPANNGAHITFNQIFDSEDVTDPTLATASCAAPANAADGKFTLVRGNGDNTNLECLRVKPGMDLAASRLETRRYSVIKGATAELTKEEGLTYDPVRKRLYVALSDITSSMQTQVGGQDHINVTANRCGAVFSLDVGPLSEGNAVVTQYAAKNWSQLVAGTAYQTGSNPTDNTCQLTGIASPDNLTYLPGYDVLVIGEDTGTGHLNDALWAYNVGKGELTRILTTPYGSEVTSPYWRPDFGGHGYLMTVVQHPYTEDMDGKGGLVSEPDATGKGSYVGVFGPFPTLTNN